MFYLFFFLLTTTYCQKFAAATSPTWIKNDNVVSGCHQVITTLTGSDIFGLKIDNEGIDELKYHE